MLKVKYLIYVVDSGEHSLILEKILTNKKLKAFKAKKTLRSFFGKKILLSKLYAGQKIIYSEWRYHIISRIFLLWKTGIPNRMEPIINKTKKAAKASVILIMSLGSTNNRFICLNLNYNAKILGLIVHFITQSRCSFCNSTTEKICFCLFFIFIIT